MQVRPPRSYLHKTHERILNMSKGKRYTVAQFQKAIKDSGGLKSTIASRLGCTYNTVQNWLETKPTVREAYDEECERMNDLAQGILLKSIKDGNTQDAKWWLARKRKGEFGDAIDVTSMGKSIVVRWDDATSDD